MAILAARVPVLTTLVDVEVVGATHRGALRLAGNSRLVMLVALVGVRVVLPRPLLALLVLDAAATTELAIIARTPELTAHVGVV